MGVISIRRTVIGNRKLIPNPVYAGRLQDEGQAVRALQSELAGSHPDLVRSMYAGIRRGIISRTTDSGE
jgi:hypothetical protein